MLNGQKVEIKTGADFDPVPMDKYTVQCVDVNLVKQQKFQSSEEEEVLNFKFAILDEKEMEVTDDKGEKKTGTTRGRYLWKRCRLAHNDRSWLGKLTKAVYGRSLTKEEAASLNYDDLVGQQVDVMVEQTQKEGKVYVNVVSFGKTVKKLKPMDEKELKKTSGVVERQTAPATAPDADDEADKLISKIKAEESTQTVISEEDDEDEIKLLEAKLAAKKKAKLAAEKA